MPKASPREAFAAAMLAVEEGRVQDALAGFDRIARDVPEDAAALCQAGLLRLRTGKTEIAAGNFEEALRRQPDNMTALFALGEAKEKLGDDEGAIEAFTKIVRHHPNFAPAHANLGVLTRRAGSLGTAIGHFKNLVRLTPGDVQSHLLLAATCHRARMMEDAIPAFRRALCLDPQSFDALYNLGVTEPLLGWREEALKHLHRALVLEPLTSEVYARIGRFSARTGRTGDAISACWRASCLEPAIWKPSFILSELSEGAEKAEMLRRVTVLSPDHKMAPLRLAETYYKNGQLGAAEETIRCWGWDADYKDDALYLLRRIMVAAGREAQFQAEFGSHASAYERWVAEFGTLSADRRAKMLEDMASWEHPPCFDIIMPVCDPPIAFLKAAIASVKAQIYPRWQLCIADDASAVPEVRAVLKQAAEDDRIKVVFREERGHISAASNSALEMAGGDYVTFLDHDDLLAEDALYWMAREITRKPQLDLIYSDEDKIDETGRRFDPHFKPEWTLELLRAQNFVCHLALYRRSLVQDVGGLRLGYEGSQDHDLALRIAECAAEGCISHIPRVLYHWRAIEGSTARDGAAKPYTIEAGARAVSDHLERIGAAAKVERTGAGFRVCWPLPDPAPHVTVIVPTRDRLSLLKRSVAGVLDGTDYPNLSLVIVDNDSVEPQTLVYLGEMAGEGRVHVLRSPGPFNYSALNNEAARHSDGDILCFLNNDTEPKMRGWLKEMVAQACREEVGVVGAKLLYPDNSVQHAGLHLAGEAGAKHIHMHLEETNAGYWNRAIATQELSAVTGAVMVMRRDVFDEVGGFDAEAFPVDFSDVDLCLRAGEAGYKTIWTPEAVLYHHESATRGTFVSHDKERSYTAAQKAMLERYGETLYRDPYSNPNLDLEALDFRPAFPPRVDELR